ncbi:MAG: hypothetical protein CMF50_05055 [Legionellales bacterium]|nr:hypothetical protein [Legionellales bacterium]|tara:strand:- start:61512 stop:61787 length:276 start_codon:yes stop_codon:yes gene_type:complete
MANLKLTSSLQQFIGAEKTVLSVSGDTLEDIIDNFLGAFPEAKPYFYTNDGKRSHYINLFLDGEYVSSEDYLDLAVEDNNEIEIVTALSGG